jgi:hypothetical protein
MQELLTIPLLATHLLAMNLASAGPLLCAWLRFRADDLSATLGRRLAWSAVGGLIVGMISGGVLLVTFPGAGLWNALSRFPASAYWFAGAELLFSLACMLAIALGWKLINRWVIVLLAVISATNLLYHFPPLMAVIGKLASNPHFASAEVIDRAALLELIGRGEVMALSFHFGVSTIAVSAIAALYLLKEPTEGEREVSQGVARIAARVAFVATASQIPIGVWLLMSLPGASRMALMGKSLGGSLAFIAAMVLSLIFLQRLFAAAIGDIEPKNLRAIVVLTCLIVLLMTASLRLSRFTPPQPAAATKTALSSNAQGCGSFVVRLS